jgi:hypothetical protein
MNGTSKFALRICTTTTLALLPFLINLLVNVMVGTVTFFSVFHVNDLMYFVITICGVTSLDLLIDTRERAAPVTPMASEILSMSALAILLIFAALLLGLSSHYIADPPASGPYERQMQRLIAGSLVVAILALVFTLMVEVRLCFHRLPPQK